MTASRQQAELIDGWNRHVAIAAAGQKRYWRIVGPEKIDE